MIYIPFKTKKNEMAVGDLLELQIRNSDGEIESKVGRVVSFGSTVCGKYNYLETEIGERITRKFVVC